MKIKSGDLILSINDKKVGSILDVSTYINTSTTNEIKINVLRNNEELTFNVIPQIIKTEDSLGNVINKKVIGIKIAPPNNEFNKERLGPATAVYYAVKETGLLQKHPLFYCFIYERQRGL